MRGASVLVLLFWVAFHFLGCVHGPALDGPDTPMATAAVHILAPAHDHAASITSERHGPCCHDATDHVVDRVRRDASPVLACGEDLPAHAQALPAHGVPADAGAARAPDRGMGGREVLAALCVART